MLVLAWVEFIPNKSSKTNLEFQSLVVELSLKGKVGKRVRRGFHCNIYLYLDYQQNLSHETYCHKLFV